MTAATKKSRLPTKFKLEFDPRASLPNLWIIGKIGRRKRYLKQKTQCRVFIENYIQSAILLNPIIDIIRTDRYIISNSFLLLKIETNVILISNPAIVGKYILWCFLRFWYKKNWTCMIRSYTYIYDLSNTNFCAIIAIFYALVQNIFFFTKKSN